MMKGGRENMSTKHSYQAVRLKPFLVASSWELEMAALLELAVVGEHMDVLHVLGDRQNHLM